MGIHYERGRLLYQTKKFKLAEKEFRDELAQFPDSADAHAMLAMSLVAQGKGHKAHNEAVIAARLAPESPYCHYTLSFTFSTTGNLADAEKSIREALRLAPRAPFLYARAAELSYFKWKYAEALDFANSGLEIEANDEDCLIQRASALVKLQRLDEADETLDSVLRISPENVQAHIEKGAIMLRKGEREKAFDFYREALRLKPSAEKAREGAIAAIKSRNPIFYGGVRLGFWLQQIPLPVQIVLVCAVIFIPNMLIAACVLGLIVCIMEYCFWITIRLDPFARMFLKRENPVSREEQKERARRVLIYLVPVYSLVLMVCICLDDANHGLAGLIKHAKSSVESGDLTGAQKYYNTAAKNAEIDLAANQPNKARASVSWLIDEAASGQYQDKSRALKLALNLAQIKFNHRGYSDCQKIIEAALKMVPSTDPIHAKFDVLLQRCQSAANARANARATTSPAAAANSKH